MDCQLLVIGGGPSGASAAYHAASAGLQVILVDRATWPRDKVCGDALVPASMSHLAELGISSARLAEAGGRRVRSYRVFRPDEPVTELDVQPYHGTDHAFGLPRRVLDYMVWQQALAAGARPFSGMTVQRLAVNSSRQQVTAIGRAGGTSVEIRARLAILSSGATGVLPGDPAWAGKVWLASGAGVRQYFRVPRLTGQTFDFFHSAHLPEGYAWVFPVGKQVLNVGVWMRARPLHSLRPLRSALAAFVHEQSRRGGALAGALPLSDPRGAPLRLGGSRPVTADQLLVCGESAGLVQLDTGEGISAALASGRLVARVAIAALADGDTRATALSAHLGAEQAAGESAVAAIGSRTLTR